MKAELMVNLKDEHLLEDDVTRIANFLKQLDLDDVIDIHNMASNEINQRHGV